MQPHALWLVYVGLMRWFMYLRVYLPHAHRVTKPKGAENPGPGLRMCQDFF